MNPHQKSVQYINLKLAMLGVPILEKGIDNDITEVTRSLLYNLQEKNRLLADYLCPADQRIQDFLADYLSELNLEVAVSMPHQTFVLDRPGLSRLLSLPPDVDHFRSEIVCSYRIKQGVLHNPRSDRRTTQGSFHIVEGGLPIPDNKKALSKSAYAHLLRAAFNPPKDLMQLPFTSTQKDNAELFVSLYLRPMVSPKVPGLSSELSMETRFFAPGNLVSNLDFVESIFGNAGDPSLPGNDAGLDVEHWSGHTGCVILAPHLVNLTKKEIGLPAWGDATERQKRDGMCWKKNDELYNDGLAFKVVCRDRRGVIVTVIADNYFGYCKKEVKSQISYACNLGGGCEEEHAGGAIAFASYDLGDEFTVNTHVPMVNHSFRDVLADYGETFELQPEGYAIDKQYRDIIYIPENVTISLYSQMITWKEGNIDHRIRLMPNKSYILPSGYKVHLVKEPYNQKWLLMGTTAEGTFCHKPSTVSGGGKSEISKPISDAIINGPIFTAEIQKDFAQVEDILKAEYRYRFKKHLGVVATGRPILSRERSLGSVIKLLTPSENMYTSEYNAWLRDIPRHIRDLVYVLKQYYRPEWGDNWQEHFNVDILNGRPGNELKYHNRKLIANYLRVGYSRNGSWRIFGLRRDFIPAMKIQTEDDISVSLVVPSDNINHLNPLYRDVNPCVKFIHNCELRLFQRPDDAIHRGFDNQTELDLSQPGNFISNFEPLTSADAKNLIADSIAFDQWTEPMRKFIHSVVNEPGPAYFVSSAHPRLVNRVPTKNPRYLQNRSDLINPRSVYLAELGTRLYRRIPINKPVPYPVNAVLPGRRNNPPDPQLGIRALSVYNPIHYMELPELFMEFICSMTGKSPSTTGAGSEGALTKDPFNALLPIIDLNSAIVSFILTQYHCFITGAGYIGPKYRVDHDISMLIPEVWCRMDVHERDPRFLIENGYLEKCLDFEYQGKNVLASRLGYRISAHFVNAFFGRVFNNPSVLFREKMLHPEIQDLAIFADSMDNIVETHRQVAILYFSDGSIDMACPPLHALLHIMRDGEFEGKKLDHPSIRALFTRENLLSSSWYADRLTNKQKADITLWKKHVTYLKKFISKQTHQSEAQRLGIAQRLQFAKETLTKVSSKRYLSKLQGTLGVDCL